MHAGRAKKQLTLGSGYAYGMRSQIQVRKDSIARQYYDLGHRPLRLGILSVRGRVLDLWAPGVEEGEHSSEG